MVSSEVPNELTDILGWLHSLPTFLDLYQTCRYESVHRHISAFLFDSSD